MQSYVLIYVLRKLERTPMLYMEVASYSDTVSRKELEEPTLLPSARNRAWPAKRLGMIGEVRMHVFQ